MQINPVMEVIYAAFKLEIANQFFLTNNSLVVTFPDQTRAVISAPQVSPAPDDLNHEPPVIPSLNDQHTFHYSHQHDFDDQTDKLLTLQSLDDCRSYLDDICENLLSVPTRNCEVTFPNGTVYLITVDKI